MSFSVHITPLGALLLLLLIVAVAIQLFYYLYYYALVTNRRYKEDSPSEETLPPDLRHEKPVSVIVYARNESDLLPELIDNLFAQRYGSDFEVIIANDASTDDTRDVVERLQTRYPALRLCSVPVGARSPNRKKLSISLAMKAARYDIVLHTEANALPQSPYWITRMTEPIGSTVDIVVGGYSYQKENRMGDWFIHFDHLLFSLRYLSLALRRQSFIGVGKNLCYKKSLYATGREFISFLQLSSGDDDLFVNRMAASHSCRAVVAPSSLVVARFQNNRKAWKYFKHNRFLSSNYLSATQNRIFSIETATRYLFWGASVAGIAINLTNIPTLSIFVMLSLVRQGVQWWVLGRAAKWFSTYRFVFSTLPFELYLPLVNFSFWTGRKRALRLRKI